MIQQGLDYQACFTSEALGDGLAGSFEFHLTQLEEFLKWRAFSVLSVQEITRLKQPQRKVSREEKITNCMSSTESSSRILIIHS